MLSPCLMRVTRSRHHVSVILVADNAEEAQVWYQALTTQILWARANRPSDPAHSSGPYRVAALSNAGMYELIFGQCCFRHLGYGVALTSV